MRRVVFIAVAILVTPVAATSQDASLTPGQIVRVTAYPYDLRRTPVTLVAVRSDSLRVQYVRKRLDHGSVVTDSVWLAVPLAAVTKLEVQAGRRSNWDKGARTGAIVGGAVGLLIGAAFAVCDDGFLCPQTAGEKARAVVGGTVSFGFVGGLLGTLIGAMSSREAWQEVPLGRARLGVMPQGRGLAVTASLRF